MNPIVVGQLGVERDREQVPFPRGHGMAVEDGEDLHIGAVLGDPWRADEHRPQWVVGERVGGILVEAA